jgi:methylated-DNA-[protein]-cysteine S-methyltransferase
MHPFGITSDIVTLSVRAEGTAVTEIKLHGAASRKPGSPFEEKVARELEEYLAGLRSDFSFRIQANGTPFQRLVWDELRRIPYGATASYGEIAARIGKPGAARAVGTANNKNPIPLVIPCHRVVAAGGKLGGFGGGLELKKRLLGLETSHSEMDE